MLHVVTAAGPDNGYGGPASVAVEQCMSLLARGVEPRMTAGWLGRAPRALPGVDSVFVSTRSLSRRYRFSSAYSVALERVLHREIRWADVAHIHFARDIVPMRAVAIALGNGIPYVLQTHGMIVRDSRVAVRILDSLTVRRQLDGASRVLALSEEEARDLAEVGLRKTPVILPNGISLRMGDKPPRRANEVLFLALLKATKRPMSFVQAAHRLIDEGRPYNFALVGPDHGELGAVEGYIREHGLAGRIRYEGALPRSEVLRRLAQATVYVLPSSYDPFPMSVLEALAARTPLVISPEVGQAAELQRLDAAEIVEVGSDSLARAIGKVMSDTDLRRRRAEAGYMFVRDRLSIDAVVDTLADVYESAIAGAKA